MKRNNIRVLIAACIILAGILLILYPFISNSLYERQQEQVIFDYTEKTQKTDKESIAAEMLRAVEYNEALSNNTVVLTDPFDENALSEDVLKEYHDILNLYGDGVMGYIEIPKISVSLPIFHGTDARTLEKGIGHLENTSLPISGESVHSVVSGHSGLSDKRLFTDLDLLEIGDQFYVQILGEYFAYEVDQILVVEPYETESLHITYGKDYMTLVTCTPYGVNSHRLLVRGSAVPYIPKAEEPQVQVQTKMQSQWMRQYIYAVALGMLVIAVILGGFKIIQWRMRRL